VVPSVTPQVVGNTGLRALKAAIADPELLVPKPSPPGTDNVDATVGVDVRTLAK
jgi:hypothetical protein